MGMLTGKLVNHYTSSYPGVQEINACLDMIVKFIPLDTPFILTWRKSKRGVPCLRCTGSTANKEWVIDIYSRSFYYTSVCGYTDTFDHPRKVVNFLRAYLKVSSDTVDNEEVLSTDNGDISDGLEWCTE